MDELTQLIKKNIKSKYSSTRRFSEELGIPQTTIVSSIKNGISGTAFTTVCKMCNALDIKLVNGVYPVVISDEARKLIEKLSKLDEKGLHTAATVIEMEYLRCSAEEKAISTAESNAKSDNSVSYPIVSQDQIPAKNAVADLLKAIDEESAAKNL